MATGTLPTATTVNGRSLVDQHAGTSPTATDGDYFANTGREYLSVYNPEASDLTVSLTIPATLDGQTASAKAVTVPTTKCGLIGPFPTGVYNDSSARVKATCALVGAGSLANAKLNVLKFS